MRLLRLRDGCVADAWRLGDARSFVGGGTNHGDYNDTAAAIAKTAAATGRTIREVAREMTNLSEDELNEILDPTTMTEPGVSLASSGG